jgi:type II secretory pathway predicted ATPase ExeA
MHKTYFGFKQYPFDKDVAGSDLYRSRDVVGCQEQLTRLQQHGGLGMMWGTPGSGKTACLRWLRDSLNQNRFRFYYLPDPPQSLSEFYRTVMTAMALRPEGRRAGNFRLLQEHIIELSQEKHITPIIVIDESHDLPHPVLAAVRMLLNFDLDSRNHAVLLLCGQAELRRRLRLAVYEPLVQRVVAHYQFTGLQADEVEPYLRHRLGLAGVQDQLFEPGAVQFIAQMGKGVPRQIDTLATRALAVAAGAKRKSVAQEHVETALPEILTTG